MSIPYCYLITHKPSGLRYYGSRYGKGCHPSDLMTSYFTSSKIVKQIICEEGTKSFDYEVRKIFKNKIDCIKWEGRVLQYIKAKDNPKYFNMDNSQSPHLSIQNTTKCIRIVNDQDQEMLWPQAKTVPKGYHRGMRTRDRSGLKLRKWFYCPVTLKQVHVIACPNGYVAGRPNHTSNKQTTSLKNRKFHWYTDGVSNKLLDQSTVVPNGWQIGRVSNRITPSQGLV
jgi:hypothetical protein